MTVLKARIERGDHPTGSRLPGERSLAREFSVSQMTMNRALNELVRQGVLERRVGSGTYVRKAPSRATAVRILLAAQYEVDPSADYYMGSLFRGIQSAAFQDRVELSFALVEDGNYDRLLKEYCPDGLLLSYPDAGFRPWLERLREQGVPFVCLGASWPGADLPCVDSDNVGGMKQAVRYLYRLGHRRIGCVLGALQTTNSRDRREGFEAAAREHGLMLRPNWIFAGPSHGADLAGGADEQLRAALLEPNGPTAVVSGGYHLALTALGIVRQLGLRVPEHVSVTGFDDPVSAAHLQPPLTTLCQPLAEMGERALRKLVASIRGEAPARTCEILETRLVIRNSCAPPEAGR